MRNIYAFATALLAGAATVSLAPPAARAGNVLTGMIEDGKPLIDVRLRYENVNDDNCALCAGRDAEAETLRARLGYQTGKWNGLSALFEFDQVWSLGPQHYDSKVNGQTRYPAVADPDMTALDRLQIAYEGPLSTNLVVGRQRIILGDQRFVGNVGWRQHEQTFDAISAVNTALPDTTLTYAYVTRINRVFGPDSHTGPAIGHYDSHSHLFNAVYTGIAHVKLEAYAYLLDLRQAPAASTATYGVRAGVKRDLGGGLAGELQAAFAHQNGYARNPNPVSLDYWETEAVLRYARIAATFGYSAMGGNGVVGFSTPLATLHKFNGWAELFLATPKNGIDDLRFGASYTLKDIAGLPAIAPSLTYHRFRTDRHGTGIGNEWDMAVDANIDANLSMNATYATYQGAGLGKGGFKDKSILWLSATYRY